MKYVGKTVKNSEERIVRNQKEVLSKAKGSGWWNDEVWQLIMGKGKTKYIQWLLSEEGREIVRKMYEEK